MHKLLPGCMYRIGRDIAFGGRLFRKGERVTYVGSHRGSDGVHVYQFFNRCGKSELCTFGSELSHAELAHFFLVDRPY